MYIQYIRVLGVTKRSCNEVHFEVIMKKGQTVCNHNKRINFYLQNTRHVQERHSPFQTRIWKTFEHQDIT
jgi:hypothetical protein